MRRLSSLLVLLLVTFLAFQPILTRDVFADPILPGTFQMIAPSPGAVDVAPSPTLTWSASSSASGYGYCIDTTDDDACDGGDGGYIRVTDTQARPDLLPDTTYSWHVRAYNAAGFTPGGSWQQFTTAAAEDDSSQDSPSEPAQRSAAHTPPMAGAANESVLPGALSKTSPVDGSSDQSATVLLSWTAASEATSYGYCFDTTADNVCDDGGERGFRRIAGTSVRISGLV